MESFWKKELVDGTIELGTDTMISLGQASWTRGRQDIAAATLYFANQIILVLVEHPEQCQWRQLDRNVHRVLEGQSQRTQRILEVSRGEHRFVRKIRLPSSIPRTIFELNNKLGEEIDPSCTILSYGIAADGSLLSRWR